MARASTVTKLPLDRWAEIIGLNPLHFNGVYMPIHPPTVCQQPWLQYAWQAADRVGREEVALAIAQAETAIEGLLGYRLLPSWEVDEWQPTVRPYHPEMFNISATDVRGFAQSIKPSQGWLVSGGIKGKTLLDAAQAITYTDPDNDTFSNVATVTAAVTSGIDPCEVRVFMQAADVPTGQAGDDRYEIKPIQVSVVGAVATIIFNRQQAVKPEFYEDYVPPADDSHQRGVDGSVDANFLTAVDVYRVYNDPQTQVSFLWEQLGSGGCGCGGDDCELCSYITQTGCLIIRGNPRNGAWGARPATWNASTEVFDGAAWPTWRAPDLARLYYYAGYRNKTLACPNIQMDPQLERAVAYYAASLLDRPICECNNISAWVEHWQTDLAVPTTERGRSTAASENPLGTTNGALFAWRQIRSMSGAMRPIAEAVLM